MPHLYSVWNFPNQFPVKTVCVCVWSTTTECKLKMCINNIEIRTISERETHAQYEKSKNKFQIFQCENICHEKCKRKQKQCSGNLCSVFPPLYLIYVYVYVFFLLLSLRTFLIKSEKPMRWAAAGHRRQ